MHKLRGSAGMLGAKGIQKLAAEAEAACLAGEGERASHLATQLCSALQTLHQDAGPVLVAARERAEAAEQSAAMRSTPASWLISLTCCASRACPRWTAFAPFRLSCGAS